MRQEAAAFTRAVFHEMAVNKIARPIVLLSIRAVRPRQAAGASEHKREGTERCDRVLIDRRAAGR